MDIFSKLGWFFRQEKKAYFIGVSLLFIVSLLAAIVPMIIGTIIDGMTNGTLTRQAMWQWIIVILLIGIAQYIMRYYWRMSIFGTSAKLEMILRRRLFVHFTKMDAIFFQENRTGDLMAHATNDVTTVRMVAGGGILTLVDALSQGLMTIFMMFVAVDWRLALAAVVPLPLLAIIIRFNGKRVHYYFRFAQEAFSSMNDKVQESMSGMKVIKTFGEEERDIEDFKKMTENVVKKNKLAYRFDSFFRPSIQTVMGLSSVISLFYGGYLVSQGEITVGLLVAFLNYVTRMGWPMIAIGHLFNILERGSVSYDRIESLLKTTSHIVEDKNALHDSIAGDIEFNIDSFTYPKDEQPTLTNVHFKLKQGQTLGVVGKTGAGKSTLFKLLLRDYDDYRGSIQFNHHQIEKYSLNALLSNIGYVPQDNFLFSTTVRDNIRFAVPSATQEDVEAAARLTSVHDDIQGFSYGYDTLVGERGVALSGGQKQRISIARAMILNPELLILDDSLSAVDARTEEAILNAVKSYRANKSTIISAHRLSSIMHADEIIVLDNGTIAERGTHDELIAQNGWYKEMFDKQQLEAELEEEVAK
ncbi:MULTISPECIES: ABC transporter transmembrane domain-containing protein [unclassified Facklamia]|uniref:ABC transporter ATP-binding protein n=1 Tax=Aerococcaceae TaxID=186827 RepID=UPI0013B7A8C0|nr:MULTISPECIES: ABC transporter transmembrane domain-containing protein [unclassified Facklamia]NEW64320.1 ATP-binding cassette domain-containing protein [Facklamia sp. 252]NEW67843.1 ATP-binding cassette domain-containing protein [Facklamia sp. 253]QQD64785.1 ATP-binding cassette domain-containing protein [Aerococcaceae bacterium zg-252]